jgi:hypothetical protein
MLGEDIVLLQTGLTFTQIDHHSLAFKQTRVNEDQGVFYKKNLDITVTDFVYELDDLEQNLVTVILQDVQDRFYIFGHDIKARIEKKEDSNASDTDQIDYSIGQQSYITLQYVNTSGITFQVNGNSVQYDFGPIVLDGFVQNASNLSGGTGIFANKIGTTLYFKSLVPGNNIYFDVDSNNITINSSGGTGMGTLTGATVGLHVDGPIVKMGGNYDEDILIRSTNNRLFKVESTGSTLTTNIQVSPAGFYAQSNGLELKI